MEELEERVFETVSTGTDKDQVNSVIGLILGIAEQVYNEGRYFGREEERGKKTFNDSKTFEQFKQSIL